MECGPHLLWDLTGWKATAGELLETLNSAISPDGLGPFVARATVLLPALGDFPNVEATDHWTFLQSSNKVADAGTAIRYAGECYAHIAILLGSVSVGSEAIGGLIEAFSFDPHVGAVVPRLYDSQSGEVLKLSAEMGDPELKTLPRRILPEISPHYFVPELLWPCCVIRNSITSNLIFPESSQSSLPGAVQHYLCHIRRAGFRTLVVNQVAIPAPAEMNSDLAVAKSDLRRLQAEHPDFARAISEFSSDPAHLHESLLGRLFASDERIRKSLLLDLRGVPAYTNGTAEAALGLCDGMEAIDPDWSISLLAEQASIDHHRLRERYPKWQIQTRCEGSFTAAFRPSQPWHLSTMIELHRSALVNFYAMLDSIAWDILFEAPRDLGVFWDFMAKYADGLLYNSSYTREHVVRRFPASKHRPEYVFHHSFDPRDYADPHYQVSSGSHDYVFVIGNSYDHKHLGPTVDLLSRTFPFQQLKVLGLKKHAGSRVEVLESGRVPADQIESLFAGAKLIVFPSFYEGFGLPVLKGLSYGRTVLARHSDLLCELAANYRGPGRLLSFLTPQSLVEQVGRVVHGAPVREVPLGNNLEPNANPKNWRDVAQGVLEFLAAQTFRSGNRNWLDREKAIRQISSLAN